MSCMHCGGPQGTDYLIVTTAYSRSDGMREAHFCTERCLILDQLIVTEASSVAFALARLLLRKQPVTTGKLVAQ